MKHIIFAILFFAAASFGMSVMPNAAFAKHHRGHYTVRYVRGRRRVVYVGSRSHGVNANGNVGVGLGPIHIGVGAGGGIQLHEVLPPQHVIPNDPPSDPPSDPPTSMIPVPRTWPQISSTGAVVAHPSDCDLECYVTDTSATPMGAASAYIDTTSAVRWNAAAVGTRTQNERLMSGSSESFMEPYAPTDVRYVQQHYALSPDVNANDYYANYTPPRVVNVGGFDVAVNPNTSYYNPFKRGRSGLFYVHNRKGVDVTAGYGVSPRAGAIPATIGGTGYTVITVER